MGFFYTFINTLMFHGCLSGYLNDAQDEESDTYSKKCVAETYYKCVKALGN